MGEMEEWFLNEYGHLGFTTTPTIYNPFSFTPIKKIMYNGRLTNISVVPELVNDISGGFVPFDSTQDYKVLLNDAVSRFLNEYQRTFTPVKNITKFNFT